MRASKASTRIFVVGTPRSGTTLVQSLLASHSRATSFTESHFFSRHFAVLPVVGTTVLTRDPRPRVREFLAENEIAASEDLDRLFSVRILPSMVRARPIARAFLDLLDVTARERGASAWLEKTPRHLLYVSFLEKLNEVGQACHFVHVVREGLATVASLHKASQSWEVPYDVATCIRRWNRDLSLSLRRVSSPNDHFVFYEDLTSDPEATLMRLLSSLGLPWEAAILEEYAHTSRSLITPEEAWKQDVSRTISASTTSETAFRSERKEVISRSLRQDLYAELYERTHEG